MQVILFESGDMRTFGPLVSLTPVSELCCGALSLRGKLEARRPSWDVFLLPREELRDVVREALPGRLVDDAEESERTLFLSAQVLSDGRLLDAIDEAADGTTLTSGGDAVGALIDGGVSGAAAALAGEGVGALVTDRTQEVPARVLSYPWEIVRLTGEEIAADARTVARPGWGDADVHPSSVIVAPDAVSIGARSRVAAGVVLDASEGPILIGTDVELLPNAVVLGPVSIGRGTRIKAGAKIYGGTSIGHTCRVGGEVEASVISPYTNKQHEGFLGHSCLGSWVNIGASTDTSDLKNTYGTITVRIGGDVVDTGSMFVGATIGDHAKTAIGTKLNTGTVVGEFANVVSNGFPPKAVPPFAWGDGKEFARGDIERLIVTARTVMGRRGIEMGPAYESRVRSLYEDAQ